MNQTAGLNVLYAAEVRPIVSQIEQLEPSVRSWEIPSFEDMLKSSPEHFQYEKQFDEARDDPVVVLHSSGSTGKHIGGGVSQIGYNTYLYARRIA